MGAESIAVIGAGMSGVAAALVLARRGRRVVLVEKKERIGATLRGFTRGGVYFDTGLHYVGGLHGEGPLTRYFRLLGLDRLPLEMFNEDCFDLLRFPGLGLEVPLPVGREATVRVLSSIFPGDAAFIRKYFTRISEIFNSSPLLSFRTDASELLTDMQNTVSLADYLAGGTADPVLRTVLSIHSLLYGVSPEETPLHQHARIAASYLEGVGSVRGGGRALVAELEKALSLSGVKILCGKAAEKLRVSPGRGINAVLLEDGTEIPVEGALFTGHPHLLPPLLPQGSVKPAFRKRLLSLEDTCSAYALFCKCAPTPSFLRGGNLFICPDADTASAFRPDCDPRRGPFYLSGGRDGQADLRGLVIVAPGSARECAPYGASAPGRRPAAYARLKEERLRDIRQKCLAHCPELSGMSVLDGATPLTFRDYLDAPGCGLYGTKHSLHQFNPLPLTGIANLWMAGQSVIAPGILGAIVSAIAACVFILGREAVQEELAACA
ncbi:MAG: FAD-dependent oxidoreductase [Desulfovibrio sp.]|jgi:all-trans-retinol 13,14-reductase|nr:FAD-dependent oxidoreductase [Desulfovibrio sp.]